MKRSVTAPERIGLTRLCNAIDVEEIDRFASSMGGPTLDASFSRKRTSGLIEATASDPTGVLATCATRLVLATTPDGATPRLDVQAFEFETEAAAVAWQTGIGGEQRPTTMPAGLSAYFETSETGEQNVAIDGRFGFVASNSIAGEMIAGDPTSAIDVAATTRWVADALVRSIELSGLV